MIAPTQQVQASFLLPTPVVDSRVMRAEIYKAGLLPAEVWNETCFFGHRHSLNLTALTPTANALADHVDRLALWLAERCGTFVPCTFRSEGVGMEFSGAPYEYRLDNVLLLRDARDWARARNPEWVLGRIKGLLDRDLPAFATAWGVKADRLPAPQIFRVTKVLPVEMASPGPISIRAMVAAGVNLSWQIKLSGQWAIGGLRGVGLGRMCYAPQLATPADVDQLNAGRGLLMTVAQQIEALS